MRVQRTLLAIAAFAVAGLGLGVYAQPKPVSSRTAVVVHKSPT